MTYDFESEVDSLLWENGIKVRFKSEKLFSAYLKERQAHFQRQGFLLSSIKTDKIGEYSYKTSIVLDRKIKVIVLDVNGVSDMVLKEAGFFTKNGVINLQPYKFIQFREAILQAASNQGYPFAKVVLTKTRFGESYIELKCTYLSGSKVYFDSLVLKSSAKIDSNFLAKYLNLKGSKDERLNFSQKSIDEISDKIATLPYIALKKKPNVLFENEKAIVELYLKDEKVNTIDGMLGFMPPSSLRSNSALTGYINFNLQNLFGRGKQFVLEWNRVKKLSPAFKFDYFHPQLFNSNLNLILKLSTLQQDSVFRNTDWQIGLSKKTPKGGKYGFFFHSHQSITLNDISVLDYNLPKFGLKLQTNALGVFKDDSRVSSIKNFRYNYSVSIGKSRLFGIDSLSKVNNRIMMSLNTKKLFSVSKIFSISNEIRGKWIIGRDLFLSEAYRLGGFNSIRGFDENAYFASFYFLSRNEMRMRIEEDSFFYLFFDFAILEELSLLSSYIKDRINPLGIGGGINIRLNRGMLKLASGWGIHDDNELTLKKARFHFGYTALF